jgi:hypothetical protein
MRVQQQVGSAVRTIGYLCLCFAPPMLYLAGWLHPFNIGNADMLAVPAFIDTLRANGLSAFSDWYWPPSPYFLPDFVIYTPLWLVVPSPWLAPAAFMVVQLGLLVWVSRLLAREIADTEASRWGALLSFSVLVLLAVHMVDPMRFVLVSYYRAGTFMAGIIGLSLVLRMLRTGGPWHSRRRLFASSAFTAALVCCDPLIVPSALLPLLIIILGLTVLPADRGGWAAQRRSGLALSASILGGIGLGLVANGAVVSDELPYEPGLSADAPGQQLRRLVDVVVGLGSAATVTALVAVVVIAAVVIVGLVGRRRLSVDPVAVVLVFWLVSGVGHVVAIMTDSLEPTSRYLQLVFGLPVLAAGPAMAASSFPAWLRATAGARAGPLMGALRPIAGCVVAAPLIAVVVPAVVHADDVALAVRPSAPVCLDRVLPTNERLTGLSGYWEARVIQLYSLHDRNLAVLDQLGNPYRLNAAASWYDTPWSFAVVGSAGLGFDPPLDWVRKLAPDAIETACGPYTILVFDGPVDPTPFDGPGSTLVWEGCELKTLTGVVNTNFCTIEVDATGDAGFGSYGGYTPVPPGWFRVGLRYRSPAPLDVAIADLELGRANRIDRPADFVQTVPMMGTRGEWVTLEAVLEIPDDGRPYTAEARTKSYGTHYYEVKSVELTLLDDAQQ